MLTAAPDTYNWQERAENLLEEAFTSTAARDYLVRATTDRTPWGSPPQVPANTPVEFLRWLASSASTFPNQTQPRPYWSQRHAPRAPGQDRSHLAEWFARTVSDLTSRGYFEYAFPSGCEDEDNTETGADPSLILLDRIGVADLWPLHSSREIWDPENNDVGIFYDLVEALHDLVARPRLRSYHSFWRHWHYAEFSSAAGRTLYRWRINRLLALAGTDLRLADAGEDIGRLTHTTDDNRSILVDRVLEADTDRDSRRHAVALFRSRTADREAKRSAIVALARLLEDRRQELKSNLLTKDEGALFQIANQFDLRHNKADQQRDYDEAYLDWIFWWYLSTLDLTDQLRKGHA